jgi:hypothetical protein
MDYREEKLPADRMSVVRDHLSSCEGCKEFYNRLLPAWDQLVTDPAIDYDPFMFTRIQAAMAGTKGEKRPFSMIMLQPVLAALIVFFMVLAGIRIGTSYSNESNLVTDYQTELYYLNEIHSENIENIVLTK